MSVFQRRKYNHKNQQQSQQHTHHVCAFGKYKSGVCLAPSVTGLCTLNFCLNSAAVGGKCDRAQTKRKKSHRC